REEQALGARFDGNQSQGRHAQPLIGLEVVQEPAFLAVGQDLVVDLQEDLRRQRLDLEGGLVLDAVGTAQGPAVFAAELVAQQAAFLGQFLVGGGGDLGE